MKRFALPWVLALLIPASALAQSQFKYVAKFVCGKADGPVIEAFANAPGVYYTTINVTNQNLESSVRGQKRFAVGLPGQKVGPSSKFVRWSLNPGTAMQIDCGDIYKRLEIPAGKFIEGFAYIVGSPVRFDAAVVYTVSDGDRPVSIDVEHLTPR